jgi:exonuclease SbcC
MQILSIHLKNIKSHRDIELVFSPGINVLSGPNGVGKSTIFEAIGYALFGVDARDFVGNIERFISIGAKRGGIAVDFQLDSGEKFRVIRTVGAASRWLLHKEVGGAFEVEDHAGAQETEARLRELLGLDNGRSLADQFKLVIGPFQNDFLGPFVIRQATKRKDAFDEILGIDAWRKTFDGTRDLLSALKRRLEVLDAEVTVKQEQLAVLPEKKKALAEVKAQRQERQRSLAEKGAALPQAESRLAELDAREKAINTVQADVHGLENRIRDGEGKVVDQKQRVAEAGKAREVLEQSRAGKEAFEGAEANLGKLRQREQQRRAAEQEVAGLEKEALRLTQTLDHERREIAKAEKQLSEEDDRLAEAREGMRADEKQLQSAARIPALRQEVENLRSTRGLLEGRRAGLLEGREKIGEGICPFFQEPCLNVAGKASRDVFTTRVEDLDREMLELDKRIEELGRDLCAAEMAQKELNALEVRMQELEKQSKGLEQRRGETRQRAAGLVKLQSEQAAAVESAAARKEGLKAFARLDDEIAGVQKELAGFQAARDAFFAHQKTAEDLPGQLRTLEKWQAALDGLKKECLVRQEELTRLRESYRPEQHQEARREREALAAEIVKLREQLEALGRDRKRLEDDVENLQQVGREIEVRLAEKKSLEEKEKLVKYLRNQVFKNVSVQLSERFREEISLRADRIYRTIAESDEELLWGENYQIVLRDMVDGDVRERSDDQLSGGQTMSAVVALRLALLQTIGARIAFFDEPTSNLDASRRENLAHAFRAIDVGREEVTEHWYDQLFLISHDVAFTEVTDQMICIGE